MSKQTKLEAVMTPEIVKLIENGVLKSKAEVLEYAQSKSERAAASTAAREAAREQAEEESYRQALSEDETDYADPKNWHPLADPFPILRGKALAGMAENIGEVGLLTPILLFEGKVLDGRNRARACRKAGVALLIEEAQTTDPVGLLISLNVNRRHLNEMQRAAVVGLIGLEEMTWTYELAVSIALHMVMRHLNKKECRTIPIELRRLGREYNEGRL